MLHINDLTYRIEGRPLFEAASAGIPDGARVGLVGRNGTGKSTLLKILTGQIAPDEGAVTVPKSARIGMMAQEAPGGPQSLIEAVLAADTERAQLLAEMDASPAPERIAEIQVRLTDIDAHAAPARAARILAGLGFDEDAQHQPCASLSGGWRMRVALAAILFSEPDFLLLDEPTNYLDFEGTAWLQTYLAHYPYTVIIASHDRDLLNTSVDTILHVAHLKLSVYSGNYDRFERTRAEQQTLQFKLRKKQDDERRRLQAFVDRFRAKATKAKQAQSRVKMLEKMEPIATMIDGDVSPFDLADPEKRLGNPIVRLEAASVGYGGGKPVLAHLDLRLDADDRIGLLGRNGNGKSTFAKLLAGELATSDGHLRSSKKLIVGYFAQHQLDALKPEQSPYDHIAALMEDATEAQKRARLGRIGFGADKADTRAKHLSGGEKARLALALVAFQRPHLLILDEPTNHLDVDSREALIQALNAYDGAVILISHDRHLLETCVDRLWVARGGTVSVYDGDLDSYQTETLGSGDGGRQTTKVKDTDADRGPTRREERQREAEVRKSLAPLKKRLEDAEKRIEKLTAQIAKIDARLADTSLYERDPARAQALVREHGEMSQALKEAEADWLEAGDALEAAEAEAEAVA